MSWRETYVYFIAPVGGGRIKIGWSYHTTRRLMELATWSPCPLEILASAKGSAHDEATIHQLFEKQWSHREWFNACPEIWALIADVRRLGHLPDYAKAKVGEPVRRMKKFSIVRTPEWRSSHGQAVKAGWDKRRERLAARAASTAGSAA